RWLHELGVRIADFEAELAAGTIAARSVDRARRDLEALRRMERSLRDRERTPWSSWLRLAGGGSYGAPAKKALEPLSLQISETFAENPAWQQDLQDLIRLILE